MSGWRRALAFDRRRPEDWAAWSLRGFLLLGVAWCAAGGVAFTYTNPAVLAVVLALGLVGGLVLSGAGERRPRLARLAEGGWLLLFALHFVGHAADLYHRWPGYDTVVHGAGGLAGAAIILAVARATGWFWDAGTVTPFRVFHSVLGLVVVGGVVVELTEWGTDGVLGTREQSDPTQEGLQDTMTDLAAETLLGALAAAIAASTAPRQEEKLKGNRSLAGRGPAPWPSKT